MRTLAIDSATEACSVALIEDGRLIAGDFRVIGRGHAELLVPMIAALPGRGRADRIAVGLGPGSFTGVRVGLAAARALGLAWKVPVEGFSTLALVATIACEDDGANQAGANQAGVAMAGGHGEWFVQSFDAAGTPLSPFASLPPQEAAAQVRDDLVAGTRAQELVDLRGAGRALPTWPDARRLTLIGRDNFSSEVHPHYGRPPDARPAVAAPKAPA